jgi:polyphosphate kinase
MYFRWGPAAHDEALYLSSADWMPRNMMRRVEVAWPIEDAAMRQRVIDEGLVPYLSDRCDAWELQPDGQYVAAAGDGPGAQQALLQRWATPATLPAAGGPGT